MKIYKIMIFMLIICLFINVNATSGPIKQNSIIKCNDKYYGNHGSPLHWHEVSFQNNKWISISGEVEIPFCYIKKINEKERVVFYKCSDGDTARFLINGEDKKVRFLAIDTPEVNHQEKGTEPFGKEASEYTCNALKNAKEIYLEYDSNSDKEDKYGRILAFVYVDGIMLQRSLIKNGLARVAYIYGDYEYLDELKKDEESAKKNKIGIWSINENLPDEVINNEKKINDISNEETNLYIQIIEFVLEIIKKIIALIVN